MCRPALKAIFEATIQCSKHDTARPMAPLGHVTLVPTEINTGNIYSQLVPASAFVIEGWGPSHLRSL